MLDSDLEDGERGSLRVLGDCELFEELGRGGMGVVWRGRQRGLDREVAVKTLPGGDLASAEARSRFRAEALAMARLSHPGIVPIFEVGESQGVPYLVMELIRGRTLGEVANGQPLPWRQAARWVMEAALAVQHAHDQGVLHRDLKPSNILIETTAEGGRPRVSDFGLAKLVDGNAVVTRSRTVLGSPAYMPPEAARRAEYTVQGDVYGLGAVLYSALTGRPPFQGESVASVISQVEQDEPVLLRRLQGSVPVDLETVCLKCLEKSPGRRYARMADLAADLKRLLEGHPVLARPVGPGGRLIRLARRHPWRTAVVGLAAALVAGAGLAAAWKYRAERQHTTALQLEKTATRIALLRAQLGEARAIVRLRRSDSRFRAEAILREVSAADPPDDIRSDARDILLAALALPASRSLPLTLPGDGREAVDWTLVVGDLTRERWAQASFHGRVIVRSTGTKADLGEFDTAPRKVTALIGFSPRGRWLAMRHAQALGVWDTLATGNPPPTMVTRPWSTVRRFGFMQSAFAPDDSAVLWLDTDSIVATSLPGAAELGRWRRPAGRPELPEAVAFEPGGRFFAVAWGPEPSVELRAWPTGEVLRTFRGRFPKALGTLALTAGAGWIAGGDGEGRVTAWRGDGSAEPLLEFRGHSDAVRALGFSLDGKFLASTSEDGSARVWDMRVGAGLLAIPFDSAGATFDRAGGVLGVGDSSNRLARVTVETSDVFHTFRPTPLPGVLQWPSFLPDGRTIACVGEKSVLEVSVPDGTVLATRPMAQPTQLLGEPPVAGGLIVSGISGLSRFEPGNVGAADSILPAVQWSWRSLNASADGRWMAACDPPNGRVGVWPSGDRDGRRVRWLGSGEDSAGEVALAPDGAQIAVAPRDGNFLRLIEVSTSNLLRRLEIPPKQGVVWSPDGRWLVGFGVTCQVWDTRTWERVEFPQTLPNPAPSGAAAFSWPQSDLSPRFLAVVTGGDRVALVRMPERQLAVVLEAPEARTIHRLEFSRDGRWLLAGVAHGEVQLWDLPAIEAALRERELGWD